MGVGFVGWPGPGCSNMNLQPNKEITPTIANNERPSVFMGFCLIEPGLVSQLITGVSEIAVVDLVSKCRRNYSDRCKAA
jgi:hypothetical protein